MACVLLFAAARQATGLSETVIDATDVAGVIAELSRAHGELFAALVPYCTFMVDGERAAPSASIGPASEVAVLPPVAGGAQ